MSTATTASPTQREPELLGQTVVVIENALALFESLEVPIHRTPGGRVIPRRRPRRSSVVSSKLILPLIAGFALCVAGSVAARAESTSSNEGAAQTTDSQTKSSKKKKVKKHPNKTELDKLERGNPHSVYYKSRKKSAPNPTNEQIEDGSPGQRRLREPQGQPPQPDRRRDQCCREGKSGRRPTAEVNGAIPPELKPVTPRCTERPVSRSVRA